jgi:hypothetical protein
MYRILSDRLFGAVDDTTRAALMLALASAALSFEEPGHGRSGSRNRPRGDGDLEQMIASHALGEPTGRLLIHAQSEG